MESSIQKGNPDDAGARALREAQELAKIKLANSRADTLKKHYNNVRLAAEANGACELIDTTLGQIESRQLIWFRAQSKHRLNRTESPATIKLELAMCPRTRSSSIPVQSSTVLPIYPSLFS